MNYQCGLEFKWFSMVSSLTLVNTLVEELLGFHFVNLFFSW